MFGTLPKVLAAIAAAGIGGMVLSSVLSTDNDSAAPPSAAAGTGAASADTPAAEDSSLQASEPWREKLTATECPEFPARDDSRMLNGNWLARWDGVPNKHFFIGGNHLDSAHLTIRSNEDTGDFLVSGPTWHRNGAPNVEERPERTGMVNTIKLESVQGLVVRTSLAYYSAPDSTLRLNPQSPDRISGSWKMRNRDADGKVEIDGSVTWDRAIPAINRVVVRSEKTIDTRARVDAETSAELCGSRIVQLPTPAVATLTYDKEVWSTEIFRLRANRPKFYIEVYGDNLWGDHHIDFDFENTGIEAMPDRQIRAADGSGRIVGLSFRFNIWEGVQPGWYTLYLDGMAIPFELDIPNFYPSVTLKYVNYDPINDTERELEEIPVNQTFWVHATVENPERFDDTAPLFVRWRNQEFSANPKKLGYGRYRAGPFMVSDNLLPSTVVPENDPCKKSDGGR